LDAEGIGSSATLYIQELLTHAESQALDICRRLRASRLLMVTADLMIDPALARRIFAASHRVLTGDDGCYLLKRQIGLIFHTIFGERSEALSIADEIEELVARRERSWPVFVARRNCSLARQLVGSDRDIGHGELERGYHECIDASMTSSALQYASYLASMLIDDGELTGATEWIRKAEALIGIGSIGPNVLEYLGAQIDLALLAGDESRARAFLQEMHNSTRLCEYVRLRNDILLYTLRVEQICGNTTASPANLTELLRFHSVAKSFGRHDDHMDVLWVALSAAGRTQEASLLLRSYLHEHRRERRSCRHFLRTRTASDPAWQTLCSVRGDLHRPEKSSH
jgi:hypothetical protein